MNKDEEKITLKQVLLESEKFSPGFWLYLSRDESWLLDSKALVLEQDEVAPEEESNPNAGIPKLVVELGMREVLQIADVQSIVINAKAQRSEVSVNTLLQAFLYYFENDSFLRLE